jgi:hypothetical protein
MPTTRSKRCAAAHGAGGTNSSWWSRQARRPNYRQIASRLLAKRNIPITATDHEVGHSREIILTLRAKEATADAHRYRENSGVQILATLLSMAINALRLDGIWSITEGIVALAHDIKGLLRLLGWQESAIAARPLE